MLDAARAYRGELVFEAGEGPVTTVAALAAGVVLTGGNAYFLAWWLSAGKPIIDTVMGLPPAARAAVYAVHYSFDVVWLVVLAYMGGAAASLGSLTLATLYSILAFILAYFGLRLAGASVKGILSTRRQSGEYTSRAPSG